MVNYAALGDAIHTFNALSLIGSTVALGFFTDIFADELYVQSYGICGQFDESYSVHIRASTALIVSGILTLAVRWMNANKSRVRDAFDTYLSWQGRGHRVHANKNMMMEAFDRYLFWQGLGLLGHGLAHLGLMADTAAGKYPPDETQIQEAVRSMNIPFILEKSLPVAFILSIPHIRWFSSPNMPMRWIVIDAVVCAVASFCFLPAWLGTAVFFNCWGLTAAVSNICFGTNKYSVTYPIKAAMVTLLPLYLMFESVYCSPFTRVNGHAFFDYIVSSASLGVLAFAVIYQDSGEAGVSKKE